MAMTWRAHNPAALSRTPVQRDDLHKAAVKQQQTSNKAAIKQQREGAPAARRGFRFVDQREPNPNGA
ncbi:hypothetical protein [Paraburkholderia strydomiana]|uniref:hypothetical protein n=1 Tax=Paraburkholderia strydomiana TaxID=1245417 RepID=UPI001BE7F4EE|nr:hypothetical protein [Paraburkholderia strydomiana]MBT2791191.1 hypothetical protein [Paraburkholderia strydomiana]